MGQRLLNFLTIHRKMLHEEMAHVPPKAPAAQANVCLLIPKKGFIHPKDLPWRDVPCVLKAPSPCSTICP